MEKLETRFGDELTKDDVYEIISEGHLIEDRFEWRTAVLDDLVYESELLFQLPRIPPQIMDSIPGREHSYYAARTCDLATELKKRYILDEESLLTNKRETGRMKHHPAFRQILDKEEVEESLEEEKMRALRDELHRLGTRENLDKMKSFDRSDLKELAEDLNLTQKEKDAILN